MSLSESLELLAARFVQSMNTAFCSVPPSTKHFAAQYVLHKFSQIDLIDRSLLLVPFIKYLRAAACSWIKSRSLRSIGFCSDQNLRRRRRTCHAHLFIFR